MLAWQEPSQSARQQVWHTPGLRVLASSASRAIWHFSIPSWIFGFFIHLAANGFGFTAPIPSAASAGVIPRATSKQNCCSAALSFSGERLAHCWRLG